jgi:MarR family 2-MHQ and catechol resistance regulon transcriptional repressor
MDVTSYSARDQTNLKLIVALTRCVQSVHRREAPVIQAAGLTMPQFGVLDLLYHKGDQKICQIIEKTLSTGGNMTVIIENLEKQGLVARCEDPQDRRSKVISLTREGQKLMKGLFPEHMGNLEKILSALTSAEKRQLIDLAKKLGLGAAQGQGEKR